MHIGGDAAAALRRAALFGDGWIPMNHAVKQIPRDAARIAQLRDKLADPARSRSRWAFLAHLEAPD